MTEPRRITGQSFGKYLIEAGIIPTTTRRFVIDAEVNKPVMIYVEQYGDERLLKLDLATALQGTTITFSDRPKPTSAFADTPLDPSFNPSLQADLETIASERLNGPSKKTFVPQLTADTVDIFFEGETIPLQDVGGDHAGRFPAWKCRACGWTIGVLGLPPSHNCPGDPSQFGFACAQCGKLARRTREQYADVGFDGYICPDGHATDYASKLRAGVVVGTELRSLDGNAFDWRVFATLRAGSGY